MAHTLDSLDKKILRLIAEDARIPFLEVARACNVSGAAIHQRIQKLTNMGVLKGSQFIIDPERHYTTGGFDMFIKIYAQNNHHLLNIIHDKLQPLGLSRSETIISFHASISRQLPIEDVLKTAQPEDEEE